MELMNSKHKTVIRLHNRASFHWAKKQYHPDVKTPVTNWESLYIEEGKAKVLTNEEVLPETGEESASRPMTPRSEKTEYRLSPAFVNVPDLTACHEDAVKTHCSSHNYQIGKNNNTL